MSADVSIIFLTYREDPRFDWFADSLACQVDGGAEVILVDGAWTKERGETFERQAAGRFPLTHVPAKPTPFAGPYRRTTCDYFSAASARNTGVIHATAAYLVFVDDLGVVMPGWWNEVRTAARTGGVIAGAYQKHDEMHVVDGRLVSSRCDAAGVDTRWNQGHVSESVPIPGNQLYGCSFGVPRALMLEVGGCDELCDTIGGEDWHLGARLEWAGAEIRYSRRMLTIESQELHGVGVPARRIDRRMPPSVYLRRLRDFGIDQRVVSGAWDSSHMIVDILFGTRSTQPMGNYYLLSALQPAAFEATVTRFPRAHWFDQRPLALL